MAFKQEDLIGFYFAYSGCPIVTFKLKEQFNIDSLESFQEFNVIGGARLEMKRRWQYSGAKSEAFVQPKTTKRKTTKTRGSAGSKLKDASTGLKKSRSSIGSLTLAM